MAILKYFKGEDLLQLIAYLQTLPQNSFYIYRLKECLRITLLQLNKKKQNYSSFFNILKNGFLGEDPQEIMFTGQVGTPYGSYTVFPEIRAFFQHNLTRLLSIADRNSIGKKELSTVYFLLEISQIIADRSELRRNEEGMPNAKELYIPSLNAINKEKDRIFFTYNEIKNLITKYNLSEDKFKQFVLSLKKINKDIKSNENSDEISLHPFYKSEFGYFVLYPSVLLHSAYNQCKEILYKMFGREEVCNVFHKSIFKEIIAVTNRDNNGFIGEVDNIKYLCYVIDIDKILCFHSLFIDKGVSIDKSREIVETRIRKEFPMCRNTLHIIVGSQIEDNEYFIMYPQDTLYFTIDDLIILFKQHFINFNKRTLYYYAQDKKKLNLIPMTQDIDIITYYLKNKQTFYQEGLFDSSMIYIEIGLGLYLRKYYMDEDLRYVYSPYYNKVIPIFHLSAGVPIYAPTVSGKEKQFIMIEIGNKKLYIHFSENPQQHYLEVAGSFALWMYAAWYKKEINILKKDTDIKLVLTNKNDIQKEDGYYIVFIDIDTLFKNTKYENIEKKLFLNFTHLLQSANVISISLTNNVVDEMFKESAGHFLMTNEDALIYSNNDIVNHQLNDRWIDIILEDISEYLNIKGKEKKLSIIESKEIIKSIINYLQQEVKALIVKFDTKEMLKSLIKIYYSTLYQSKIIRKGFNSINNAYRYIGTELDQQFGVNSENSTIGIITQGIIEFIILNNIDNQSSSSSLEDRDKLFALMYHIAKMGSYMDMFNNEIPNTELTILKNGRIVIPDIFFRINNEYFLTLRKREIADLKLLEKQHQLLPPFILDVSDKNFLQAFIKEYGISFDVYKSILSTCSDYSINKNTSLVELSKNKFDSILHKLNEVEKNAFYKSFVLKNDLNDKQKLP